MNKPLFEVKCTNPLGIGNYLNKDYTRCYLKLNSNYHVYAETEENYFLKTKISKDTIGWVSKEKFEKI